MLLGVNAVAFALVVVTSILVPLAPVGAFLSVRYAFTAHAAAIEGSGLLGSLRSSWTLTRGRWFHTALTLGVVVVATRICLLAADAGCPVTATSVVPRGEAGRRTAALVRVYGHFRAQARKCAVS